MKRLRSWSGSWLFVGLLGAGVASPAWGWGRMGHRAAGRLAEELLTAKAKAAVRDLLEAGESVADASTWADEIRRDMPESGPWHYVNVSITQRGYSERDCPPGGCVISKLEEFRKVLANPKTPKAKRAQALRFVIHLVQDLHQPLHVGDRRDKGGNDLQLQFNGRNTNLHRLWDSDMLEASHRDEIRLSDKIRAQLTPENRDKWAKGGVKDWASESFAAAQKAYRVPGEANKTLHSGDRVPRDYAETHLPVAERRLAQSSARLARILNEAFP